MQRAATCSVCLDKFRIPKVLPCKHTFCLTPCLSNLVDPRERSIRCPECHREHAIPQGGIQAFPSDLNVMGYPDLPPPTTINLPDRCFRCKQQKQTLINCEDCTNFFCSDCREPHLRETFFSISSSVGQLRHALPTLSTRITSYEQRAITVKANYEQIQRDIATVVSTLIDELKRRELALLHEAATFMQSQLEMLRTQKESAEFELAGVRNFCESVGTSFPNGQLIIDKDLAQIRFELNRYSQEIDKLQNQIPFDLQRIVQLRVIFNDQAAIASGIQNFGQLINLSEQQPIRFLSAPQPPMTFPTQVMPRSSVNIRPENRNEPYRLLENLYHPRNSNVPQGSSFLSQTIAHAPMQNNATRNTDNSFGELNLTVPARTNASSYVASWDPQMVRRSTSNAQTSSIFGANPFAPNNPRPTQQRIVPPPQPSLEQPGPQRNYGTSMNAARSLDGDDRPIFGGSGGASTGGGRGPTRGQVPSFAPAQNQGSFLDTLQRQNTFVLDHPSLPNLPQSGAQKPRDKVNVEDLYNVRRQTRAKTPLAFTVDLEAETQS